MHTLNTHCLHTIIQTFTAQKNLADRALAQVPDGAFYTVIGEETNSLAVIIKHMSGNMRSRWQDFLTSDGEKPDRNRDDEFIDTLHSKQAILECWEDGWRVLLTTLASLTPEDLLRTVTIRAEPHSVLEALLRQVSHYAYHVGQIVLLARHACGEATWQSLSIPKGQSQAFTASMQAAQDNTNQP